MTNLVEVTIRTSSDASGIAKAKLDAARAGTEVGKAYADAFDRASKTSASRASGGGSSGGGGGLVGSDPALLKKLESQAMQPGGIGIIGTGTDQTLKNLLRNAISNGKIGLLSGGAGSAGAGGTGGSGGTGAGNAQNEKSTDLIKQVLTGAGASNQSTTDTIRQVLTGKGASNTSTTDVIKEIVDSSGVKDQGAKDGESYGSKFLGAFAESLKGGGGGGGEGGMGGAVSDALNAGGAAGGALPGMLGISGLAASIAGIAGILVSVLPAIMSVVGGLAVIGGGFAILMATDKKFAAQVTSDFTGMESVISKAVQPLAGPLLAAMSQLSGFVRSIGPELGKMFGDAAPLIQPLVKGLEGLVSGLLPGFISMIKDAEPVFKTLAGAFSYLGSSLGAMFGDFAKAEGPSAVVLKAILDLVSTLFPVLGKLGEIFATALAPAVAAFGKAVDVVLPALTPLFSILGEFAGAVLTDLAGLLMPVGTLLKDLAPSFTLLAKAASQVFNTMESAGVFAVLGSALETIAPVLGNFINLLVKQLAPFLPTLMNLIGQFAGILTGLLAAGLTAILSGITYLLQKMPLLAPIVAGLVVGFMALDAALAINPFIAIGIAIVVLVGVIVKYHTQIWNFIVQIWSDITNFLVETGRSILSFAEQWWPLLLGPAGLIVKYHQQMFSFIESIWSNIVSFFSGLPGRLVGALSSLGGDLRTLGSDALNDFWDGVKSIASGVLSWFTGFGKDVIGAVKDVLGVFSPSTVFYDIGKNLMEGLKNGVVSGTQKAISAAQVAAQKVANVGSGVARWTSDVQQALKMEGLPLSLTAQVLRQISSESGGNPNAINNTDINAQHGDPSRGLLQTIGTTFAAYHWPGTSDNIYDPLANIAAAINYARHEYGPTLMSGGNGLGSGHGYDSGGWLPTGTSIAVNNTGAPERVIGPGGMNVTLTVGGSGNGDFDAFMMKWIKGNVRIKGGGDVQVAFGRN